jgi:hypothetical protein
MLQMLGLWDGGNNELRMHAAMHNISTADKGNNGLRMHAAMHNGGVW